VQVAEFFEALGGGKDVEVVITRKPEGGFRELFGYGAFDGAKNGGERMGWRLGQKEVDVFGHDYVAEEVELVFFAHGLEGVLEDGGGAGGS
jgi:hypothetical protein